MESIFDDKIIRFTIFIIVMFSILCFVIPFVADIVSSNIDDTLHPYFTGNVSIGSPGEDHMPYGWMCYEKTPHNTRINKKWGWAVNQRGICEWR
jgi:hypothetical protein